jgi:acyl CoA:acetate/3-ketoacid CoA transferase beta subunit
MTTPLQMAQRVCWALACECRNDDVLVVGVATPMATAAAMLARRLLAPDLTVIAGAAVDPPTIDVAATIVDPGSLTRSAPQVLGQRDLLLLIQRGAITLQFVSPAQVDPTGAINTSRVADGDRWRRLPGCLALPDTAVMIGRLVAYRIEGGDRFLVDAVDHVTGAGAGEWRHDLPGSGVVAVITDEGRRPIEPARVGWAPATPLVAIPSEAAELLDREIDPHGVLAVETRRGRAEALATLERLVPS